MKHAYEMVLGDPRQAHQRTQSLHFPSSFIITRPLPAARALKHQAPCLIVHEHSTGSERVDALGLRAVEVIICMITRDFSVISIDVTGVSLSLPLTKVTHAQYRKRGSPSYIVREVLLVRERERYREREREIDGSDVTIVALKLAMNLHFPLPKFRTIGNELTLSLAKNSHFSFLPSHFPSLPSRRGHHVGAEIRNEFTLSIAKKFFALRLCSPSFKWLEPRDE